MPDTEVLWAAMTTGPVRLLPVAKAVLDVRARQPRTVREVHLWICDQTGQLLQPGGELPVITLALVWPQAPLGRVLARREWKPALARPPIVALQDGPEILLSHGTPSHLAWQSTPAHLHFDASFPPWQQPILRDGARLAIVAESSRPCWCLCGLAGE